MKYNIAVVLLVGTFFLQGCSNRRNTWSRRSYQELTTKYNVNFNGYESLNEGLLIFDEDYVDNYSDVLPVFKFDEDIAGSATPQMERAQDKAQKAIERHSIKKKPQKKSIKYRTDPDYYKFYNQDEFNDELDKSWMLLGEAQFYKAEFMRAIGTFKFIADKYIDEPGIRAHALIWKARCYSELQWFLEATTTLADVNETGFPDTETNWYKKIETDLLLKQRSYKQAIAPLQATIASEKVHANKVRYMFILAQIYQELEEPELAYAEYSDLLKKFPNAEMAINAQIKRAEVMGTSQQNKMHKKLTHLLRRHKDDEYTCRIYYALGNIGLGLQDTLQAEHNYQMALQVTKQDTFYMGLASLALGNIYKNELQYREAADYYIEAPTFLNHSYHGLKEARNQAQHYSSFKEAYDAVALQDSLNYLAALPETEREAIIDKLVDNKKKQLEQEKLNPSVIAEDTSKEENETASNTAIGAWYFYNPDIVAKGKVEFKKQWGNRELADSWRTENSLISNMDVDKSEPTVAVTVPEPDSTPTVDRSEFTSNIPLTADAQAQARVDLERQLLNLAYSYQYDVEDLPLAIETFERFEREFPQSSQMGSVYYAVYDMNKQLDNTDAATEYRNKILDRYSNTRFGLILTDPNFIGRIAALDAKERSDYNNIYTQFVNDDASSVLKDAHTFATNYENSEMIPQVTYMQAIAKGKLGNMKGFEDDLKTIQLKYNNQAIAPLANSVLMLFNTDSSYHQMPQLPAGSNKGLLDAKDQEIQALQAARAAMEWKTPEEVLDEEYTYAPQEPHYFAVWVNDTSNLGNDLLYETARLNFTKFVLDGYGLGQRKLNKGESMVLVGSFADHGDALAYGKLYKQDTIIQRLLGESVHQMFTISEKNLRVLSSSKNSVNYMWFYNKYYLGVEVPRNLLQTMVSKDDDFGEIKDELTYVNDTAHTATADALSGAKVPTQIAAGSGVVAPPTLVDVSKKPEAHTPEASVGEFVVEKENVPHYYGIVCLSGSPNKDSLQAAVDHFMLTYNPSQKLTIDIEENDKIKLILIGDIGNKEASLQFLYAIVKDENVKRVLKNVEYRNAVITKRNADLLIKTNNIARYSIFFNKIYLGQ